MKNKSILLILMTLLILPSCMVTKSRYGNGIHIDMPEVFKKDKKLPIGKLHKSKKDIAQNKKKNIDSLSKETHCKSLNMPSVDNKKTVEELPIKPLTVKIAKVAIQPLQQIKRTNKKHLHELKPTHISKEKQQSNHNTQKTSRKSYAADNDYFGWIFDLIGKIIVAALIIALIIAIVMAIGAFFVVSDFWLWLFIIADCIIFLCCN